MNWEFSSTAQRHLYVWGDQVPPEQAAYLEQLMAPEEPLRGRRRWGGGFSGAADFLEVMGKLRHQLQKDGRDFTEDNTVGYLLRHRSIGQGDPVRQLQRWIKQSGLEGGWAGLVRYLERLDRGPEL